MKSNNEIIINEIADLKYGKSLPDRERKGGPIPVYGSGGIGGYHDKAIVQKGIIIGRKGSVGTVRFSKTPFYPIDTVFFVDEVKGENDLKFFYYFLQSIGLSNFDSDAAVPGLNRNLVHKLKAIIPEPKTQQHIASILSAYDDLIEVNNDRIKLLEETARELYKEWFVRMRFPGYKKAKFVKGVPEGWEVKKLGEVIELAYGKALKEEERKDGEFLVYGSSGIVGTHTSCIAKAPGIVVGRKGNVGSVFWVTKDFYPIDTAFFVKTKISLYYCYFNLKLQNFIEGDAAVPGLNRNQAYSLFMLIPTNNLLQKFDDVIRPIFQMVSNLEDQNSQLRQIRDRLLPRLISGKLEVKEILTQKKDKV